MDIDFLPYTGFGYPTLKIWLDSDLAGLDFSCNYMITVIMHSAGPYTKSQLQHIMSISLSKLVVPNAL